MLYNKIGRREGSFLLFPVLDLITFSKFLEGYMFWHFGLVCGINRTWLRRLRPKIWLPKIYMGMSGDLSISLEVTFLLGTVRINQCWCFEFLRLRNSPRIIIFLVEFRFWYTCILSWFLNLHSHFSGQPRRHLLTTGWSTFVTSKRLVAGDAFVFLRC